ncbi:MAG: arginase family protein [Pseudomonadales bacterium]
MRELGALNYVGADMVDVAPPFDEGGMTSLNGATIAFEIRCLLAERFKEKSVREG